MKKQRIFKSLICLVICALMLVASAPTVFIDASAKTNKELKTAEQSNLSSLKKKKEENKKKIQSLKDQKADKYDIKIELEQQKLCIEAEILSVERLIAAYETMLDIKQTRRIGLALQTETNYENFKQTLRYNYMYGQYTDFELFFSEDNLFDFLSDDEYSNRILNYDKTLIEELEDNTNALAAITKEIETEKAEKEGYYDELNGIKKELVDTETEIDGLIVEIQSQLNRTEEEQKKIEKQIAASEAYIDQLTKKIAQEEAAKGTKYKGGKMTFPIPASAYTRISSGFGYRVHPVTGQAQSFHKGIDLPAPKNTKIFAASSGTVTLASYNGSYGNCVMISHGGGVVTVYGHCNSIAVKVGQTVKEGDVIAYVGTTGRSTGNHLHFEVREGGTAVDPIKKGYISTPR